jgi:phosphoribosyl-ATP pyrophosphohydrolase/phosphoribosyl-AMP cyclohydrolase
MVAFADRDALERTAETGFAHFFSRSRRTLWRKGETSGHTQRVREIRLDCDGDTVLYRVEQTGPACHTGTRTCFSTVVRGAAGQMDGRAEEDPGGHLLSRLATLIAQRAVERPEGSYTVKLLDRIVASSRRRWARKRWKWSWPPTPKTTGGWRPSADLLYHLLVLLQARGIGLDAVLNELENRAK